MPRPLCVRTFSSASDQWRPVGRRSERSIWPALLEIVSGHGPAISVVGAITLLFAVVVAFRLNRTIAGPLSNLAQAAQSVSVHRNYSIRLPPGGADDIGLVIARFNDMLGEIEHREVELRDSHEKLEEDVILRTSQLSAANALLTASKNSAEHAARANAELSGRLALVLDSAAEGMFGLDETCSITFVNRAAAKMLGRSPQELLGQSPRSLICRHDAAQCVLCGGGSDAVNPSRPVEVWTHDGLAIPVEAFAGIIHHADGAVAGMVVSFRDVRERLAIEKMKDEFVSVVSHELRTPLTSIRGALGMLGGGILGEAGPRAQRMIDIALRNTDRLIRLVNDMLDVERLASGRFELSRSIVNLGDLMRESTEALAGLADKAGVRLEVAPTDVELDADHDRLIQVLTNLISNAVKFSPAGAVVRTVARRDGNDVVIEVSDEGRGIPADMLERVFERFQQVTLSDAAEKGGSGLGLPICRSIVEAHGGTISAASRPGEGSTFTVRLPGLEPLARVS